MDRPEPAIVLLALWVLSLSGHAVGLQAVDDGSPQVLSVATLNLAHGRGLAFDQFRVPHEKFKPNIDAAAAVILRESPEVLAVQEADAPSAWSGNFDHVDRLAKAAALPHVHHGLHMEGALFGVQLRSGTALLARRPLTSRASHRFVVNKHPKGYVTAEIEFAGRSLLVASIHLASGSKTIRRQQAEQIINVLRLERTPMVLMGDFNSTWDAEDDALRMIASSLKLEAYEPSSRELATFRTDRLRTRIDWILISTELEFLLGDYRVWPDRVSDHLGVAAKLRWR